MSHECQSDTSLRIDYKDGELAIWGPHEYDEIVVRTDGTSELKTHTDFVKHWRSRLETERADAIRQALEKIDPAKLKERYPVEIDVCDPVSLSFRFTTAMGREVVVKWYYSGDPDLDRVVNAIDDSVPLRYRYLIKPTRD